MEYTYTYTCKRCNGQFTAQHHGRGNRRSICDGCRPASRKEYLAAYEHRPGIREKRRVARAKWRQANPDGQSDANRRHLYGISGDELSKMLEAQKGVCAICERPERATHKGKVRRLGVDHCHASGKVRGMLCHHCNAALGHLEDRADLLDAAAAYLRK